MVNVISETHLKAQNSLMMSLNSLMMKGTYGGREEKAEGRV